MTTVAPAFSAAASALTVRVEMVPSDLMIVPSRSVATRRGLCSGDSGDISVRPYPGSAVDGLEHLAAEERAQRGRHDDRAVGLLVVLQERDDRARDRDQRAVQRRDRTRTAVAGRACGCSSRRAWNVGAVRGRRQLAVACPATGTRPRSRTCARRSSRGRRRRRRSRGRAARARRGTALPGEQPLVLVGGVLRRAEGEHLDLVELVHPDDALGVLAVRAGLAPEARTRTRRSAAAGRRRRGSRPSGTPPAAPPPCRRGRGRRLEPVDLGGVRAEEAGALHRLVTAPGPAAIIGVNPAVDGLLHGQVARSASSSSAPTPVRK